MNPRSPADLVARDRERSALVSIKRFDRWGREGDRRETIAICEEERSLQRNDDVTTRLRYEIRSYRTEESPRHFFLH